MWVDIGMHPLRTIFSDQHTAAFGGSSLLNIILKCQSTLEKVLLLSIKHGVRFVPVVLLICEEQGVCVRVAGL